MKRFILLPILTIILFSFSSCNKSSTVGSLNTVPTIEELSELTSSKSSEESGDILNEVMTLIDEMSDEDIHIKIEESISHWADRQSLLDLDDISINFAESLLLHEDKNQKLSNDIIVKVDVFYDVNNTPNPDYQLIYKIFDQIVEAVQGSTYGMFKVYSIEVNYFDTKDRSKQFNQLSEEFREITAGKQAEDEYHIQSLAYEFVREFNEDEYGDQKYGPLPEITLKRFGLRRESDELYIEIPIYTLGDREDKEREIFTSSLEDKSQDLYNLLISDKSAMEYLRSKNVSTITISYSTPWEAKGNNYYTFSYDL